MLAAFHKQRHSFVFLRVLAALTLICAIGTVSVLAAMLLPDASGDTVYQKNGTTIDASHADQGYVMIKQKQSKKKLKVRLSLGGENMTYNLNSNGEYEVFPLQLGSGKYKVQVFSQVSGSKYSTVSSQSFKAELVDESICFLYPNQYVNYNESSLAVKKAEELCAGLSTDREKFEAAYDYVVSHVVYDYIRALAAGAGELSGYLPDVDEVYTGNKGICFDFAAVLATMLRSQGVACKLVIGYADRTYHAWNEVYLDGAWVRCDATSEVCATKVTSYTDERVY